MTTDLQAAIARLTADEYEKDAKVRMPHAFDSGRAAAIARRAREEDLLLVAAATLDARPITAEGLKEREFEQLVDDGDSYVFRRRVNGRRMIIELDKRNGAVDSFRVGLESVPLGLWPQTMGDVATLLLRLERGNS